MGYYRVRFFKYNIIFLATWQPSCLGHPFKWPKLEGSKSQKLTCISQILLCFFRRTFFDSFFCYRGSVVAKNLRGGLRLLAVDRRLVEPYLQCFVSVLIFSYLFFDSIQSRVKPGVAQGMLVSFFDCFWCAPSFYLFDNRFFFWSFYSYPGLILIWFRCVVFFWFVHIFFGLRFLQLAVLHFGGSWAYIDIWVPFQVEVCSNCSSRVLEHKLNLSRLL